MPRGTMTAARAAAIASIALCVATAAPSAGATVCLAVAGTLAFGLYDSLLLGNNDTTATVTVSCTPGVGSPLTSNYTITLAGTGVGGDTIRTAAFGSQRLYYQLYKDPGRTVVWGNGSSSGSGVSDSVTSTAVALPASQTHVVYARAPGRQQVAPGVYLGSLLITVDY